MAAAEAMAAYHIEEAEREERETLEQKLEQALESKKHNHRRAKNAIRKTTKLLRKIIQGEFAKMSKLDDVALANSIEETLPPNLIDVYKRYENVLAKTKPSDPLTEEQLSKLSAAAHMLATEW